MHFMEHAQEVEDENERYFAMRLLVPDAHVYESGATTLQRPAPAHAE